MEGEVALERHLCRNRMWRLNVARNGYAYEWADLSISGEMIVSLRTAPWKQTLLLRRM